MPVPLARRTAFDDQVEVALRADAQAGALIVAEIDDWEALADQRGSAEAEAIAAVVARLWGTLLRDHDLLLAEQGQMLVFLPANGAEDGRVVAERLCSATRLHPVRCIDPAPVRVTVSAGVAAAPDHGATVQALYDAANAACQRLVAQGRDGAAVATPAHHEPLHRPLAIHRFAGRGVELGILNAALADAFAGNPRVMAVVGASGMGAAALLRQMEPEVRLRGGSMVFASSAEADLPIPYGAWIELMRAIGRRTVHADREWKELHHLIPGLGDPVERHSGSQHRLLEEITAFIRAAATERPLMIVLDEMQWADGSSWDALEHLMENIAGDRLLVALTVRNERQFVEATERRRAIARLPGFKAIELSALTRDEVKQWVEGAFHRQPVGRDLLAFVYRQTEGNPFFISQLLQLLVEEGALWYSGSRWEWTPVSELRVPSGLQALISHRVERLSSSCQAVLTTAAVIGREFDIGLIVAARAGSDAAVRLAFGEAVAASILRPTAERRRGGYRFVHDRMISVLLDRASRELVRDIHGRVAHALAGRGDRPSAEIAAHYDRAGQGRLAHDFALRATAEAERVYAYSAATLFLKMAARTACSPAELAEVRLQLAHLAEIGGRFDEVEELCDLAIEWFEGQGDAKQVMTLRRLRQAARMALGQPARVALEALQALEEGAETGGFERERVSIRNLMSEAYSRLGDRRTAQRVAAECVAMAESMRDPELLADALSREGRLHYQETPARAEVALRRALALYEELSNVRGQVRCYNTLAITAQLDGRIEDAVHAYTVAKSVARVAGVADVAGAAAINLGIIAQRQGEYDRARELFAESIAVLAAVKNSEFQLLALFNMAISEMSAGRWRAAAELYESTLPLALRIGQSDIEIGAVAGQGLCLIELGRIAEARASLASIAPRVAQRPDWFQGRELYEALAVRLAAFEGRTEEAIERLEAAIQTAESVELWAAAWLAAECAESVLAHDNGTVRSLIKEFAVKVEKLGYSTMTRRYEALADS